MSSDIYIPLRIALSHPGQFQFDTALNGDIEDVRKLVKEENDHHTDWDEVESSMKPVLMCKFGARETWRPVEVFDHDLHITVAGAFREWIIMWLEEHGYTYQHIIN